MVKNIIKNGVGLLNLRQTNIISAATVIMIMISAAKVLGVIKFRMLSARFSPEELGIYLAAFRLPNLVFEFLVLGALTSAFIPVFTGLLSNDKKKEAFSISSSVINISIASTLILAIPIFIFAKEFSLLLAPGFSKQETEIMASYTRIVIFAQVIPLVIGNFLTGMLQSFKRFLIPALAPVVYDVGIILCIYFLTPVSGLYAPVYGVVVGAFLFLLIQIPLIYSLGYRHQFVFDFQKPQVKEIGKLMLPRSIGLAAAQVDSTTDLILASTLGARSVTIFSFAQTLHQLPILLFGSTIAQAALPSLAEEYNSVDRNRFKSILLTSLHQILFLVFPASILLLVLRIPLVRLAYGAKLFDWDATILTGKTLAFLSVSIFAQSAVQILARAFYALHESRSPVIIGILSVFMNVILSILFINIFKFPIWALGLSTSLASIFNFSLLLFFLDKKLNKFDRKTLFLTPAKIFIASLITGIFLYIPMKLLDQMVFDTTRTVNLIILTATVSLIGFVTYLFLAVKLQIREAKIVIEGILKIGNYRKVLTTTPEVIDGETPNP